MSEVSVLVLMGGPDAEREISLRSGAMVASALREAGGFIVHEQVIDRLTSAQLRELPGEVIFPVLHGPFGEGGPLQDIMEADGRPYVGSRPRAARLAMDKMASKLFARTAGIRTPPARVLVAGEPCDLPLPLIVKPIDNGSSVGVRRCFDAAQFAAARAELEGSHQLLMAEQLITGREITVGILERDLLPTIEIITTQDFYNYDAKYERADTTYVLDPELPENVKMDIAAMSKAIYERIGCRDLARIDFMVNEDGAWFIEINSMPGMTDHSLVPKAAAHAGVSFAQLCSRLVQRSRARMMGSHRTARPAATTTAAAESAQDDGASPQESNCHSDVAVACDQVDQTAITTAIAPEEDSSNG
ncbi:MAG: D-alanine--D-alanine ligase [Phycisphaerales bacterium]|nr:D-alanine--D-alanine ligase [Phycisphaerales bacterium]